jgi:hypothetical protein
MRWPMLFAVLLLAGCVATSSQLAAIGTRTLCVDYAQSVLTGRGVSLNGFQAASGQQISEALAARGARCTPMRLYYRLAALRLAQQQRANAALDAIALRCLASSGPTPLPAGACGYVNGVWTCEPPPCGAAP